MALRQCLPAGRPSPHSNDQQCANPLIPHGLRNTGLAPPGEEPARTQTSTEQHPLLTLAQNGPCQRMITETTAWHGVAVGFDLLGAVDLDALLLVL